MSRVVGYMGLGGVLVILFAVALLAWEGRERLHDAARAEARAQAEALADHAGRLFEVADVALRGTANAIEGMPWDAIERSETLWRQLRAQKSSLPYVEDVWLNDETGRLRLTTFAYPTPPSNASDRESFRFHRQPNDQLHVGAPILGRVTTRPTFLVSRRVEAEGSFAGMVSATASLAYFTDYWSRLRLPYDARVALLRLPALDTLAQSFVLPAGTPPAIAPEFGRAVAANPVSGTYRTPSPVFPGQVRFGAWRKVGDLPLVVRVSMDEAAVDRAWADRMVPYGAFATSALAALAVLSAFAFREARREAAEARALAGAVAERTAALGASEDLRRLIVEGAADDVILTMNPDGVLTSWSPGAERILGWTAAEAIGRPYDFLFDEADRAAGAPAAELAEARRVGVVRRERWRTRKDGRRVFLNGSIQPLPSEDGREAGFLKVAHDDTVKQEAADALRELNAALEGRVAESAADLATAARRLAEEAREREAAEAQLRQVQKMEAVGQLTGGIAHDFNNMLAVVISGLTLLRKRLARGETGDLTRFVDTAMDGATRAATLTARLLAFSRQQALQPEAVDANRLVAGMSELLRRTIGEAVRTETVLAGGLWRAHADPGQLENALVNLAVNARDAMPEGGRLTIETANCHLDDRYAREHGGVPPGQYVLIAVTDTGSGMAEEVKAKAFDPFFTTKPVGKGTGLGLSQVYGFVRQTGGHVKIYSEPGQGTTVKIYLPRFHGDVRPAETREAAADALPAGRPDEVVLAVEDEPRVREMTVASLRELGYTALHASDAAEALRVLDRHPDVTLLFTDIVMPDVNGRRLADEALRRRPGLKVLFTTGFTRNAVVHNGVLDPGVSFLPKPFTIAQLAAKVRATLDARAG